MEIRSSSGYEAPTAASTHIIKSSLQNILPLEIGKMNINLGLLNNEKIRIEYNDYKNLYPTRVDNDNWILNSEWAVGYRPITSTPFWFNQTAKIICIKCDGFTTLNNIILHLIKSFPDVDLNKIIEDLLSFLLFLEEYDLIEFKEVSN